MIIGRAVLCSWAETGGHWRRGWGAGLAPGAGARVGVCVCVCVCGRARTRVCVWLHTRGG